MAQFDIHRFRGRTTNYRYVVDIQNDLIDRMDTRLVIPAVAVTAAHQPMRRLNPVLEIDGVQHYRRTQELAAIRRRLLGDIVGSARPHSAAIISAIDMLITG